MAGSYPDVPGRRMAYDEDGTVVLWSAGPATVVSGGPPKSPWNVEGTTQKRILNNEDDDQLWRDHVDPNGSHLLIAMIFPELRDIDGFFFSNHVNGDAAWISGSADTTNGIDGTWTQLAAAPSVFGTGGVAGYRTLINPVAAVGRRALKLYAFEVSGAQRATIYKAHIYGEIAAGQTPDRLLFIDDVTGLEFGLPIDYGDIPRGSSEDRLLKLQNNSATLTANTVTLSTQALYLTMDTWFSLTLPGGSTFQATQQIASIGPTITTAAFTLRRVTPGATVPFPYAARLRAAVASWT